MVKVVVVRLLLPEVWLPFRMLILSRIHTSSHVFVRVRSVEGGCVRVCVRVIERWARNALTRSSSEIIGGRLVCVVSAKLYADSADA